MEDKRLDFMTDEEIRMVDDYITKIDQNRGYLGDYYTRWEKEQEAYSGDQPTKENRPNSRVNIINANIEGQVAALIDQNIAVTCRGEGPSDQPFAEYGRILLDWWLRKNRIKRKIERHERRRELFGPAWFKLYWDADAIKGFGLACVTCPPNNAMFVDMKITDPEYLQDAEYIAEVMLRSKTWAKKQYGDMADNIHYGNQDRSPIFTKEKTTDDDDAFWLIQLWTKTDGKLRKIEFSEDGILLSDSFKEWTGKKFKDLEKPEAYYRYNKYPYFLTNLYYEEGKLLGFGDGKLLRPLQDMINDLYDQIRRAARPYRVFFDPDSEVELEDMDEDDGPIPCREPNTNISVKEVGRVNPAMWQLLNNIHQEVQRVTRFSELMMGQNSSAKTATESAIQQQQGNSATDHKKSMLEVTLQEMCEYALDLMMENYTEAKAFRIDENKEDYEWIDTRQLNNIPAMVPSDDAFLAEFMQNNPGMEPPLFKQLEENGQGLTKSVDFDIEISIGAGLPKNKSFLYQMAEKLSGMVVEGKNIITWRESRDFLRDWLGLPLEDDDEIEQQMMMEAQQKAQEQMMSADAEGLTANGAPMMSNLPEGGML